METYKSYDLIVAKDDPTLIFSNVTIKKLDSGEYRLIGNHIKTVHIEEGKRLTKFLLQLHDDFLDSIAKIVKQNHEYMARTQRQPQRLNLFKYTFDGKATVNSWLTSALLWALTFGQIKFEPRIILMKEGYYNTGHIEVVDLTLTEEELDDINVIRSLDVVTKLNNISL